MSRSAHKVSSHVCVLFKLWALSDLPDLDRLERPGRGPELIRITPSYQITCLTNLQVFSSDYDHRTPSLTRNVGHQSQRCRLSGGVPETALR